MALAHSPYDRISVRELCALAGVSTRTFYSHFRGKQECFLAAHELARTVAVQPARRALAEARDWRQGLERAVALLFGALADNERAARCLLLEGFSAGALGAQAARRAAIELAEGLTELQLRAGLPAGPPWLAPALVCGGWRVVRRRLSAGRAAELPELAAPVARWLAAALEAAASKAAAPPRTQPLPAARGGARELIGATPSLWQGARPLAPRQAVIQAALELGCRAGCGAVTGRAVARAAGLSARRFGQHFPSGAECLAAALVWAWGELADRVAREQLTASARLCTLIDALARDLAFARLSLQEALTLGAPGVGAREQMMASIEALLCRAAQPQLEADLLREAWAGAIWGALCAAAAPGSCGLRRELAPALLALGGGGVAIAAQGR